MTDLWDYARYHAQDEHGAYDGDINDSTKTISAVTEKGSRTELTE
jgi:hypothetical protein